MVLESTIDGSKRDFHILSNSAQGYCSVRDADSCQSGNLNGISFNASFEHQPGEQFFSRLFPFDITTEKCSFQAFIPLDSDYRAQGLSLHTECPLLALGELIFPGMSHTINFISSTRPDCFVDGSLGVENAALVIESRLTRDRLRLGQILTLKPSDEGPTITTVFGKTNHGFVSELNYVEVMLFGTTFMSQAIIRNNLLTTSVENGYVFEYPAELVITAPANQTDWNNIEFIVEGNMLEGEGSFIANLSAVVQRKLEKLAQSGASRFNVAQMSLKQSSKRLTSIRNTIIDVDSNLNLAKEVLMRANQTIQAAKVNLMRVEENFNKSEENLRNQVETLNALCTEDNCEDVCMPGDLCRNCSRLIFVNKTSKCPKTVNDVIKVRIPPFFEKVITWRFVLECRYETDETCEVNMGCLIGERLVCYGKCVPVVDSLIPVYHWANETVEVMTYESCMIEVFNSTVPDTCCDNVPCAIFAPNASCVRDNAICRSTRQNASESLENESKQLFLQLKEARKNLSLAQTAKRTAEVEINILTQRRNQLDESLERLERANTTSTSVYRATLDEIEPLLRINESINQENFFRIVNVTFNEVITNSPRAIDLNIVFEKDGDVFEGTYSYIASHKAQNLERMADNIIDRAYLADSKRSVWLQTRITRQASREMSQRELFASRCTHISNTQLFFMDIATKLTEVQTSIEASREGTSQISQRLTAESQLLDEEFAAYLDLIRTSESLATESLLALESTIFSEWQASMEFLYSESASVGEVSCDGFADCLQTAADELQILIDLTPGYELSREFVSLQQSYPMAVASLLDLALLSDISINEGLDRISPIIKVINAYATENYWCNEPPIIITDPPAEVNVSLDSTLRLLCEAESRLALTYEWRRDGNVLPQHTAPELIIEKVQRLDSANYTCFANNPVGSAESITTSVTVYELPEFYLLPKSVSTYYGDGNGAWFACNASSWPYPGWRWFHRNTRDREWTLIEGEETNELLILNPQEENVGMYVCEAYNYHGSIRSDPVTLKLLPFSVSQHKFPLQFSIFMNSTDDSQQCSLDDLYDAVYSLVSVEQTSPIIEDFNITKVDMENYDISLNLLSTDVNTYYIHLLTFAEIATLALPPLTNLHSSVQLIRNTLDSSSGACQGTTIAVVDGSVVVGKLTYVCPPGQRLNSDYLLCGKSR